jgi:hypothetical protein
MRTHQANLSGNWAVMMCDESEDVAGIEPYQRWSKPRAKGMRNETRDNSMPKTYRRMGIIDVRG